MPLLLSEPPVLLVALLAVLGLAAAIGGLAVRFASAERPGTRAAGWGLLAVGVLLLVLTFAWLIAGFVIESPREEAERRVGVMADAVTEKNWAKFGENVSDSFEANGRKKADLKRVFDQGGMYNLRAVAWDFAPADTPPTETEVVIQFEGKVTAATGEPLLRHFEATFVKDPDGKFRMKRYQAFNYVEKNKKEEVP